MKKIDMEIKKWFYSQDEEWAEFLKTETIDEAFNQADFDYYSLEDLIKWLRKYCD